MNRWEPYLIGALSGSLITAVIQMLSQWWQLRAGHKLNMETKQVEAGFADERRRLEAHLDARDDYLVSAEIIARWADMVATHVLGPETDYYDPEGILADPNEQLPDVLKRLRVISIKHPTSAVRSTAGRLYDNLRGFYCDISRQRWGDDFPIPDDSDRLLDFLSRTTQLVENLHEPATCDFLNPAVNDNL